MAEQIPAINFNKNKMDLRSQDQTASLYKQLTEIFPDLCADIMRLLNENPFYIDVNFFTSKILDLSS